MAELSKEYAAILEDKKKYYEKYKEAWEEMIAYRTAKQNEDKILGLIRLLRKRITLLQKVESETMMGDKNSESVFNLVELRFGEISGFVICAVIKFADSFSAADGLYCIINKP